MSRQKALHFIRTGNKAFHDHFGDGSALSLDTRPQLQLDLPSLFFIDSEAFDLFDC